MLLEQKLLAEIRNQFPRAARDFKGRHRAFLDNGAGSLTLGRAAEAERTARLDCSAEPGSAFDESVKSEDVISKGRRAVADLLNAPSPNCIVSGESATSLLYKLSYAIGRKLEGDENIVTTDLEHYANISPWLELRNQRKVESVRFARFLKEDGTLDVEHLRSLVNNKTRVIAVTAASNLIGTKPPLVEIAKIAREAGALFVVDSVHHLPHGPVDVQVIDCDFLVFSGYKFFSTHGSFLYGKQENLFRLDPYKVAPAPTAPPSKWEWGNRDPTKFAAISAVIEHLMWIGDQVTSSYSGSFNEYGVPIRSLKAGMTALEEHGRELSKIILSGIDDVPGIVDIPHVKLYGPTDPSRVNERHPTFAFKIEGIRNELVIDKLWNDYGIALRTENYYSRAAEIYGSDAVLRASFLHYNTKEETTMLLDALNHISLKRSQIDGNSVEFRKTVANLQ